jgi:RsiW-degrading membrane proteinase PrsW (M82 family)
MNYLPILVSIVAAVIPTLLYVLVIYWADRYEHEPLRLLLIAFFWGAVPAVIVSVAGELLLEEPLLDIPAINQMAFSNVLIAPIIEETAKWLALLGIYFFRRKEFDGPLDGLVYGALIGFGFAMTENIFFFVGAYNQGGYEALTSVFILRGIIFGMSHAFYTALAGIALGIARNSADVFTQTLWILLGLVLAIVAHSLHNLGAVMSAVGSGMGLSIAVSLASFSLLILTVVWSWQHERTIIEQQLADEIGTTLSQEEYVALTGQWRMPIRLGPAGSRAQQERRALCVELALCKERLHRHGPGEPGLVRDIQVLRRQLMAGMRRPPMAASGFPAGDRYTQ